MSLPPRRRPRVALVSWHTSPAAAPGAGRAGGMNVYVRELAAALGGRGMSVDVITGARRAGVQRLSEGVRLLSVPAGVDPLALPRYDVVHSHYWQSAAVALGLRRRGRARHVHTFHTLGEVKNAVLAPGDVPEPSRRLAAERAIASAADAVVVATTAERAQVVSTLGAAADRVHVVAPGVDAGRFAPAPGRRGELLAVHVGRIQPLKGIELAVRALGRIGPELGRSVVLALAGGPSGPTGPAAARAIAREARRLPAGVAVRPLGRVDRRRLPGLLGAADVAVVPSRAESFCLAALEAQACGVPVVGTAVGGLPEFVIDGVSGHLAVREEAVFAQRLGDVLGAADGPRARMRAAAAESAARFSWEATAAGIAAAYEL